MIFLETRNAAQIGHESDNLKNARPFKLDICIFSTTTQKKKLEQLYSINECWPPEIESDH